MESPNILKDLFLFRDLGEPFNMQRYSLFSGFPNQPVSGYLLGKQSVPLSWEDQCVIWNSAPMFGNREMNRLYEHIFSGIDTSLGPNICREKVLLAGQWPIETEVNTTRHRIKWCLEGCLGLPKFDLYLRYKRDPTKEFYQEGSADKFAAVAGKVFPEPGAVIGFVSEISKRKGALIFRNRGESNIFEVDCVCFSDGADGSADCLLQGEKLVSVYSGLIKGEELTLKNVFAQIVE